MTGISHNPPHTQAPGLRPHNMPHGRSAMDHSNANQQQSVALQNLNVQLETRESWSLTHYSPSRPEPTHTYQPSHSTTQGTNIDEQMQAPALPAGDNPVLAFVEQHLQADLEAGADKDKLQQRLNDGFEGFMRGYNEATEILQSMGLFDGEVKSSVETMFRQSLNGFAELADKYDLEVPERHRAESAAMAPTETAAGNTTTSSPAPSSPQAVFADFLQEPNQASELQSLRSLLESTEGIYANVDAESAASRDYSFQLRTADGDRVTINASTLQYARYRAANDGDRSQQQFNVRGMENFQFSVQGNLDAEELGAIGNLLGQLNDVADTFFNGDVAGAFDQALKVGFDSDEIARFSLDLNQSEYTRVQQTYTTVANLNAPETLSAQDSREASGSTVDNRVTHLSQFLEALEKIRERAERFDLQAAEMAEFAAFAKRDEHSGDARFERLEPTVKDSLKSLEKLNQNRP